MKLIDLVLVLEKKRKEIFGFATFLKFWLFRFSGRVKLGRKIHTRTTTTTTITATPTTKSFLKI